MERGYGYARANVRGDGCKKIRILGERGKRIFHAFLPDGCSRCILHAFDETIHLFRLDPGKVIAYAHVEGEAARIAQVPFAADDFEGKPGLNVFLKRLLHGELRRPFAIITLILRADARAADARCKLGTIHFLHGFKLKKACARIIGCDDIFRELRIGACGRAKRRFNCFAEQWEHFFIPLHEGLLHTKDRAVRIPLAEKPIHQFRKSHRGHAFAHGVPPCCKNRGD